MKGIYIFLADGFEEIEALATLDVLRRGGLNVKTVSIHEDPRVTSFHGVPVFADETFDEFLETALPEGTMREDVLLFPGGMPGTRHLAGKQDLIGLMQRHYAEGGTVAAICAAPGLVVSQLPDLKGKKFTCYDGFQASLIAKGAEYVQAPAVADGNLVTGRGPGCAVDFGLTLLEQLQGKETADRIRREMMLR